MGILRELIQTTFLVSQTHRIKSVPISQQQQQQYQPIENNIKPNTTPMDDCRFFAVHKRSGELAAIGPNWFT